jgi:acyl-ACP thioesterase
MVQLSETFKVRASDCQPDGQIKPYALMQCLQEAAAQHAEQLGVAFADLDAPNGFWVQANLRLEVARLPRWNQALTIRTWPSGFTRLLARREFIGLDEGGAELCRAASEWMILDKRRGRPQNLTRLHLDLPADGPRALVSGPSRLRPRGPYETALTLRVPFSALDFNGHVNNTEYVRWAFDALHVVGRSPPAIQSMDMTYLAEAFAGEPVEVMVRSPDERSICVSERRAGAGAALFVMEMTSGGAEPV